VKNPREEGLHRTRAGERDRRTNGDPPKDRRRVATRAKAVVTADLDEHEGSGSAKRGSSARKFAEAGRKSPASVARGAFLSSDPKLV
jgi:hypothetical protein